MFRILTVAVALACLSPALAHAQSARDRTMGRRLFRQGVAAARHGHWARARDRFSRAYELSHFAPILVNLAAAEAELGHLVEASDDYSRYLNSDEARGDVQQAAQQALDALGPRIPELTVTVHGAGGDDQLMLDDQPVPRAAWGTEMPVNPGAHHLALERASRDVATEDLDLDEGQHRTIDLQPPPAERVLIPERAAPLQASLRSGEASGSQAGSHEGEGDEGGGGGAWWPWALGGAVVIGAAIAVTLVLLGGGGGQTIPDGFDGNLGNWRPADGTVGNLGTWSP